MVAALPGRSIGELQKRISSDQPALRETTYGGERVCSRDCRIGLSALLLQDQPQEVGAGGGIVGPRVDGGSGAG